MLAQMYLSNRTAVAENLAVQIGFGICALVVCVFSYTYVEGVSSHKNKMENKVHQIACLLTHYDGHWITEGNSHSQPSVTHTHTHTHTRGCTERWRAAEQRAKRKRDTDEHRYDNKSVLIRLMGS